MINRNGGWEGVLKLCYLQNDDEEDYVEIYIYIRGSLNKFPDFFRMGTFIDMEVLLCERVNDLRHSLFHLLNCLITKASELRE